jgi:hypothetical protein
MLTVLLILTLTITVLVSILVFRKHKTLYLHGRISRIEFLRSTVLEIFAIIFAMILAGLLYKTIAQAVMAHIGQGFFRRAASILLALLVGAGAGLLTGRVTSRA